MSGNARIGGLFAVGATDRQRESVDDRRVHRRVLAPRRSLPPSLPRGPCCNAATRPDASPPQTARRRGFAPDGLEERRGQPGGLVGVPELPRLSASRPPRRYCRSARPGDRRRSRRPGIFRSTAGSQKCRAGSGADLRSRHDREIPRRSRDPIEERAPDRLGLLLIEALEDHRNRDDTTWRKDDLFAPMRVEERLAIEFEDFFDEATMSVVGRRLDGRVSPAEEIRKLVRAQSQAGDDAEPAAAAFQRPEEIGIRSRRWRFSRCHRRSRSPPRGGSPRPCHRPSRSCRNRRRGSGRRRRPSCSRRPARSVRLWSSPRCRHDPRSRRLRSTRPAAAPRGPRSLRRRRRRATSTAFMARVQTSSESAAFEDPW